MTVNTAMIDLPATSSTTATATATADMEDDALKNMEEENEKKFSEEDGDDDDDDNFEDAGEFDTTAALARQGSSASISVHHHSTTEADDDAKGSSYSQNKKELINSAMVSFKENGSYDMSEDVYAFIRAAPVCSWPFVFACGVIGIKYIVYGTLLSGIKYKEFDGAVKSATAVKFFLIPVAVAMQGDLMAVYAGVANTRYDSKVLRIAKHATETKFILAYFLRLLDGLCSLTVNFMVMLTTDDVLSVFLNFAALHFLQDIDDVFYRLVEKGFFGDGMEHMSMICKQISWPRRVGTETRFSEFVTSLDTILFALTMFVCLVLYIFFTYKYVVTMKSSSS